jgi:formamidopyrimidine-DNA glycosylase
MEWGITEVEDADRPIDVKVRDHMKVRNRKGESCPVCGQTIRRA